MIQELHLLQTSEFKQKLTQCVHCGLCLESCPTYAVFGVEMEAPRGRIALIRAASQGRISPQDFKEAFSRHILLCLACRACETACPSGVKYSQLIETTRLIVEHNRRLSITERFLRWFGVQQMMPRLALLKTLARLMWLYERTGLQKLIRRLDFLPASLKTMEAILPAISLNFTPHHKKLGAHEQEGGSLLFFTGCIQEAFLAAVNQSTIRVLQRNGYQVYTPPNQTCCGAAHIHLGDIAGAQQLARQNIDTFLNYAVEFEAIICNAGGCGLALKEYPHLLQDDLFYAEKAQKFAAKVQDVSEFLSQNLRQAPLGEINAKVTYADSCHLRHGQGIVQQPRSLLKSIPGLQLIELTYPDRCCGSAGIYNISQVNTASQILNAKLADIAETGADLVVTSNTGCKMQLLAGVRQATLPVKVMHIMEVLDLSYQRQDQSID
jgi:glycolate oxidase iron-sulfur subunit